MGEHGVYEWNYYEPELNAVIHPLLYSYVGDKARNTIASSIEPSDLFPSTTIHQQLANKGIHSHIYQPKITTEGPYSQAVLDKSISHGYVTPVEGLVNLTDQVNRGSTGYHYFYYSEFDTMAHNYGPNSPQADAQILLFLHTLETYFFEKVHPSQDTLVLIVADHGQVEASLQNCFYLNIDTPEIVSCLKTLPNGQPIIPAGSPRDFFLHVQELKLDYVRTYLTQKLQGQAEVYLVQDLIDQGFFGPVCSSTFLSRVGNLVILSYAGQSAWWFEEGKFWQRHHGNHGGLTPAEMDVPFIAYPLS